jgi:hypothetical protein
MRVRDGHGWEEALLRRGINTSEEMEIVKRKRRNGGSVRNVRVGSHIPFLTTAATRGDATVQWSTPEITDQWLVLIQQ